MPPEEGKHHVMVSLLEMYEKSPVSLMHLHYPDVIGMIVNVPLRGHLDKFEPSIPSVCSQSLDIHGHYQSHILFTYSIMIFSISSSDILSAELES